MVRTLALPSSALAGNVAIGVLSLSMHQLSPLLTISMVYCSIATRIVYARKLIHLSVEDPEPGALTYPVASDFSR